MIGDKIRTLREDRRLTTTALAQACEVSVQAVSNWETIPGRGPSREVLPRLASALGVTVDELLRDDQPVPMQDVSPEGQPTASAAGQADTENGAGVQG